MNVELAEERIRVLPEQISPEEAEGRAAAKKLDAFGTLAKMGGLLSRPKDDEFELVYREHRLQPFWRLRSSAVQVYERTREYRVPVAQEVRSAEVAGEERAIVDGAFRISGIERCREESSKEVWVDALTRKPDPALAEYMKFDARDAEAEDLAAFTAQGAVVVPPEIKASALVRDAIAGMIVKIDADRVLEETVRLEAVELYYRPVHAFKYRRQGKEAVVEVDALTGVARPGGATFEQYVGKVLEPRFLIEMSAEAAALFIPGANIAKVLVFKGMDMRTKA